MVNYEEIIPLELSTNPQAEAAPNLHEPLSLQLVNNMAYWYVGKTEYSTKTAPIIKSQAVTSALSS